MRLSTSTIYDLGVAGINNQMNALVQTQQQISTGKRLLTAADDPVAAAQALDLTTTIAENDRFASNRTAATNSLGLVDTTLTSVTSLLQSVKSTVTQAGDASLDDSQRGALATQLQGDLDQMMGLANTTDSAGQYLFAGSSSSSAPFVKDSTGAVQYTGDQTVRNIQISPTRQAAATDSGDDIFQRIQTGNGVFTASAAATNTGGAVVGAASVTTPSALTGHDYSVTFSVTATGTTYSVTDNTTPNSALPTNVPYTSGSGIAFDGLQFQVSGNPADGDQVEVKPAATQSLFQTMSNIISALKQPVSGTSGTGGTRLANTLSSEGQNLDNALTNISRVHAQVGSTMNEIDGLNSLGQSTDLQNQTTLSSLQDVDYAKAASNFSLEQVALQAAQKTFTTTEGLSLFNFIQ